MKRIIRLTESDLARIVKRVINESKTPVIDAGYNSTGQEYLVVTTEPTITGGAGYNGVPSTQVKFQGFILKADGTKEQVGNQTIYSICGRVADASGGGATVHPTANFSRNSTKELGQGTSPVFRFFKGGKIAQLANQYCASKGVKIESDLNVNYNWVQDVNKLMA